MRKVLLGLAVCGLLLLLSVGAFFRNANRPLGPAKMTVIFSGFTNDASGARLAAFLVSNSGAAALFRLPLYTIEESWQTAPASRGSLRRGATLVPGQSRMCLLPAPTNQSPWRVVFIASNNDWRRRLYDMPLWVHRLLPSEALVLPVEEAPSDWIGASGSAPRQAGVRERLAAVVGRGLPAGQQTNSTALTPPVQNQ